jgi:biopolymer transport protein ExbD/biopolymer transport protein TolR
MLQTAIDRIGIRPGIFRTEFPGGTRGPHEQGEGKDSPMGKYKAAPPVADINVTPMVDVMLVMLIIFMVITPMLSKGVSVDLVKTKNPIAMADADKEDAVLVAVTRDGRVYLNTTQMTLDSLPGKVKDMLTNKLNKVVYVKADSRARFEKVVEVVDTVRSAGVDNLGLLTEQIQQHKQEEK